MAAAVKVEPLCETIEELRDMLKQHHIDRLQTGNCSTAAGISLMELVTSLDRIAAHCSNVTLHMMQKVSTNNTFDVHEEAHNIRHSNNEADIAMLKYYKGIYVEPVEELGKKHKPLLKDIVQAQTAATSETAHGEHKHGDKDKNAKDHKAKNDKDAKAKKKNKDDAKEELKKKIDEAKSKAKKKTDKHKK
jgi:phosphate:Na+ symporter